MVDAQVPDKPGKFEIDISDFIKMAGPYEWVVRSEQSENLKSRTGGFILQGI